MTGQEKIEDAFTDGKICKESFISLSKWLHDENYEKYQAEILDHINKDRWKDLDDCFYKIIEFGTGGRRGSRGIGPNRINLRTIGESAQGLADYIYEVGSSEKGVVVAYDTRHGSREFAEEVCCVLAGNSIHTFLYPAPRSTPQLSFSIRYLKTQAGCMISASHNPPSDNGIKISWEDGGQVLPPHDTGIIGKVTKVDRIRREGFRDAIDAGKIRTLDQAIDEEYLQNLKSLSLSDARDAIIAYSPLHGVGATNVVELLEALNFQLITVSDQMVPDPDFSTVKNQLPNPELKDAMEKVTSLAAQQNAAIALASDPDADRLGATIPCPKSVDSSGWMFLTGNQIGVLILDHILRKLEQQKKIPKNATIITTIVTSEMMNALCECYKVEVKNDLLVGFKYIAETTKELLPEKEIIFTCEESHGFNRGTFVRDKDSAPAALYMAELASELQKENHTIYEHLYELYRQHGYFCELTKSVYYPGKSGRDTMLQIMNELRTKPPEKIADFSVESIIDRSVNEIKNPRTGEVVGRIDQHKGNVMVFNLSDDGLNRITARPSGTEPKIKFYAQLWAPVDREISNMDLEQIKKKTYHRAETLIQALSNPEG